MTSAGGRGADVRVRVVDQDQRPVPGATVSAVLPAIGAGGHFRGGDTIATERTDSKGEAEFSGIRLRKITGEFITRVLARSGARTGSATLTQTITNAPAPAQTWRSRRRLVMLGVAGAGIAAGVVAATYGGGSTAPATAGVTVTPGNPTTTGPR
ncbi:MAG TPA: hypothetical protein VER03_01740 [Bryobacteraceae bacterium]|nr:hypothetical protein [Bryobacteraceae bacterium]